MSSSRRETTGGSTQSSSNAPRQNVYFVPRDGIDREVITADICRYLGNDALVRPGTYQDPSTGQLMQGYHITAYRNLTSAMIQSLKEDSSRWDTERRSRTAGSSSRFSGASSAAYPGSDAPGYSGSGGSQQSYSQQFDSRQQYSTGQYQQGQQGQAFPPQNQGGDRYASQPQGGAYPNQASYGYAESGPPYVNVGAHRTEAVNDRGGYASTAAYPAGTYPPQGQDPRYYQGQPQAYAQPVDPMYGRGNPQYATTTQADYGSSAQPGYTATQSRHHRDREHRESSSRHGRR
ncbi:unnamed protein product [Discula destructiva]